MFRDCFSNWLKLVRVVPGLRNFVFSEYDLAIAESMPERHLSIAPPTRQRLTRNANLSGHTCGRCVKHASDYSRHIFEIPNSGLW